MRRRFGMGFLAAALVALVVVIVGMRIPLILQANNLVTSRFDSRRTKYGGLYTGLWAENLRPTVDGGGRRHWPSCSTPLVFPPPQKKASPPLVLAKSVSMILQNAERLHNK